MEPSDSLPIGQIALVGRRDSGEERWKSPLSGVGRALPESVGRLGNDAEASSGEYKRRVNRREAGGGGGAEERRGGGAFGESAWKRA